jgi:hypothetical protein
VGTYRVGRGTARECALTCRMASADERVEYTSGGLHGARTAQARPGWTMCEPPASTLGAPESIGGLGTLDDSRDDVHNVDLRRSGPPSGRLGVRSGGQRPIAANVQSVYLELRRQIERVMYG